MLALCATAAPAPTVAAVNLPSGHFTWTGSAAAGFALPTDVRLTSSWRDSRFGLEYQRYQQYAAPRGTFVDGAQLTVVSRNGTKLIVGGAYYPGVRAAQLPALTPANAIAVAADARGGLNEIPVTVRGLAARRADLRLDPVTGRLFFLVATGAPANNRYQEIDAQTGELLAAWSGVDQVSPGQGIGVKGDTKALRPDPFAGVADLTSVDGSARRQLVSTDGTFSVYNANGGASYPSIPMNDGGSGNDDIWNAPAQAAAVDAQYYAALTVKFYRDEFGYDFLTDCNPSISPPWPGKVRSVVHFDASPGGNPYDNAFWDEQRYYMVYGDGSTSDRQLSAGQDVVSHELTHGVTQCRADLNYQSESGALNESFSDIMATAAEWAMEEPLSSNCRLAPGQTECADWTIGEDLARTAAGAVIRDFAKPQAEGQPSHYSDRLLPISQCTSGNDYCGVHVNSGIPNHAFYLMVNGGRNARCSGPTDARADCNVMVPPISIDHAMQIFFSGFGTLNYDATMCDARNATVAAAGALYPGSLTDVAATLLAWQAVGLGEGACDPQADFSIGLSVPTVTLAPGQSGQLELSLTRGSDGGDISFSVDAVGPMSPPTADPGANPAGNSAGSSITVTADGDATDGVYPILITATGGGDAHYLAGSLVVDSAAPSVSVSSVRFVAAATVSTTGVIPLRVIWNATDSRSGLASTELDHSPDGSSWTPIYGPGPYLSPTTFNTSAGPHQFQVLATDAVGNVGTSVPDVSSLTAYQENAPQITLRYKASWSTFNSSSNTPWGRTIYSKRRGAAATLTFTGTDIVWVAQRGPKRGVANVFVDGVKTHVDLRAARLSERRVVFVASNLAAGQHTIRIVVRATLGRPRVDLDGFFVLSQ